MAKNYATSNFFLAAYLETKGYKITGVDRSKPFAASIMFADSTELRDEAERYWDTDAAKLCAAYKQITERAKC